MSHRDQSYTGPERPEDCIYCRAGEWCPWHHVPSSEVAKPEQLPRGVTRGMHRPEQAAGALWWISIQLDTVRCYFGHRPLTAEHVQRIYRVEAELHSIARALEEGDVRS